jgi:hypothetical protein
VLETGFGLRRFEKILKRNLEKISFSVLGFSSLEKKKNNIGYF